MQRYVNILSEAANLKTSEPENFTVVVFLMSLCRSPNLTSG